jgi:hypothetical protein
MRTSELIVRHGVTILLGVILAAAVSWAVSIVWPEASKPVFIILVIGWLIAAIRYIAGK